MVHKQEFTVASRWVTKFVQFRLDLETFKLILVMYLCLHVGLLKWITSGVRHRHDRILEPQVRFHLSLLGWSLTLLLVILGLLLILLIIVVLLSWLSCGFDHLNLLLGLVLVLLDLLRLWYKL